MEIAVMEGAPMKLRIIIEYDEQTGSYSAYCPELPGCASCGDNENEATENIKEAIDLYLEPDDIPLEKNSKIVEIAV
jgi:predicted RNase H-like HicB family nuclease